MIRQTPLSTTLAALGAAVFLAIVASSPALAQAAKAGAAIAVERPLAAPTPAAAPTGAVYLSLQNKGKAADKLLGASTPRAKRVELHTMSMTGDVMRMREVDSIEIKPGEKLAMTAGSGYHVMLVELASPLKPGDKFPMTLHFEKAGAVKIEVLVQAPGNPAASAASSHSTKH